MKIAIYGRVLNPVDVPTAQLLIHSIESKGWEILVYEKYYRHIKGKLTFKKSPSAFNEEDGLPSNTNYVFSVGGDGTLLNTIGFVKDTNIPIIGINTGRMGFLAGVDRADITQCIDLIEAKNYTLDPRSIIEVDSTNKVLAPFPFAMNEFALHKRDTASMITVHTYLNGTFLNSYWVDGVILATPTGSTGYSLSCRGPIIEPSSHSFVITPVAPHNLTVRPIIIPDSSTLSFEVEGRSKSFLCAMDSRHDTFGPGEKFYVKKANFQVQLLRLPGYSFLQTLRNKLMWGADKRNNGDLR